MMKPFAASLFLASLAACTPGGSDRMAAPGSTAPSPAAQVTGPAQNCLGLRQFSSTRVRDDYTIDFIAGAGNKAWRVTLPNRCTGLKSADTFSYETSLTQLCQQDIIYPLQQIGGRYQRMGGCGMGRFVPVTLAK